MAACCYQFLYGIFTPALERISHTLSGCKGYLHIGGVRSTPLVLVDGQAVEFKTSLAGEGEQGWHSGAVVLIHVPKQHYGATVAEITQITDTAAPLTGRCKGIAAVGTAGAQPSLNLLFHKRFYILAVLCHLALYLLRIECRKQKVGGTLAEIFAVTVILEH